jgi:hypothetical protein
MVKEITFQAFVQQEFVDGNGGMREKTPYEAKSTGNCEGKTAT